MQEKKADKDRTKNMYTRIKKGNEKKKYDADEIKDKKEEEKQKGRGNQK